MSEISEEFYIRGIGLDMVATDFVTGESLRDRRFVHNIAAYYREGRGGVILDMFGGRAQGARGQILVGARGEHLMALQELERLVKGNMQRVTPEIIKIAQRNGQLILAL